MPKHSHEEPKQPCASDAAWEEAEQTAFRVLCEATRSVPGTNAFLGEFNGTAGAFYFNNESIDYDGEVFYAPNATTFEMGYTALGVFLTRAECQRWAMRIMQALPVCGLGNIGTFRLASNAFGKIEQVNLDFGGEGDPVEAWQLQANFDLVIRVR